MNTSSQGDEPRDQQRQLVVARIFAVSLALALTLVAHRAFDPAPIPLLGVVAGGAVALAARRRLGQVLAWSLIGCVVGSVVHFGSHWVEGRLASLTEMALHLFADAGWGLLVGGVILATACMAERVLTVRFT